MGAVETTRRNFLKWIGLGTVAARFPGAMRAADAPARPNILYIMADDHALEAISCYGKLLKDHARTPNIDRIAQDGMRFNNVCCNNSICSPSRASILTGQYSHKNGVPNLGGTINNAAPWVSVELQKAGYQTAVVGKWHLGNKPKGFDDYAVIRGQGEYFNPVFDTPAGQKKCQGYCSDVYTDTALEWLTKRDRTRPFCLMLHFKAPHHPYDYPERCAKVLEGVKVPEPESLYEDIAKTSPLLKSKLPQQMDRDKGYYDRHKNDKEPRMEPADATDHRVRVSAAYQHMAKKYIRCVTAVDENVGRLLDWLNREGLANDTVVIYTSDQGYWLGQHGLYDKRLILEESLKMPFLVRYPREIQSGTQCDDLCSNVDFAETLLDFAGAPVPPAMQGRSMRPLMRGQTPADWPQGIFYCYWGGPPNHWGVRTDRYTLAHFPGTDEIEFYDLQKDPSQMHNVAADNQYAEAIAETEKLLQQLIRKVDIAPEQLPGGKGVRKGKAEDGGEAAGKGKKGKKKP